eukprot:6488540-Amphidinium_carterae.1
MSLFVLASTALGFNLAYKKGARGCMVTWIGAKLNCDANGISVKLKDQIFEDLKLAIGVALQHNFIKMSLLRSLVGKASFAAGLMPVIRPFLIPLWAALHSKLPSRAPEGSIWTKQ